MSLVLSLLACGGTASAPAPEPAPEPAPAAAPEPAPTELQRAPVKWDVKNKMHEHFAFATDAVYHTIRGDLTAAKAEAEKLAEVRPPDGGWPEGWEPHIATLKRAAAKVGSSQDVAEAASGAVSIGQACGSCHTMVGGPQFTVEEVVGGPWPSDNAMDRHSWSAYLMWLGIITGDGDLYAAGVDQLAHPDGALPGEVPDEMKALEEEVHERALAAAADPSPDKQAAAYTTFLQTCSQCHTALDVTLP